VFGAYVELPFIPRRTREAYGESGVSLLAFEEMVDESGRWPLLAPLSIICGRMLPQIAARYLETFEGGRGKLIMGALGVAPCNVAIVGAGTLGTTATNMFQAMGARVAVLDRNMAQLERLERNAVGHLTTLAASPGNIGRVCRGSDVVVLAIHCPEGKCDKVLTHEHVKAMGPGTVIIDASITQGGAAETSRPTDVLNPTYVLDGIVHYCVTRITSTVARTTSRTVSASLVPYLLSFAQCDVDEAVARHKEFDTGVICLNGTMRRKYDYLSVEE
jgi:alanine dehydrogenase